MVSDEIIKVLNELGNKFGIVVNWTDENILPYAQELMQRIANYRLTTGITWLVVAIIMTILAIIFAKKLEQCGKEFEQCGKEFEQCGKELDEEVDTKLGVYFLITTVIAVVGFGIAIDTIPEAIFLPEVSAIRYINTLI